MAAGGRPDATSLHLHTYMYEGSDPPSRTTSPHCCPKSPAPCSPCWETGGPQAFSPCGHGLGRVLVFIVTGVLLIVTAFLTGVIYFSLRTLTTSLEHIETIPTYANGILLLCTGILVVFLYKRRDAILLVATLVLNLVCCVLCGTSAILTSLRSLRTLKRFEVCQYDSLLRACHCYITKVTEEEFRTLNTKSGELEYVFAGSPSCGVIQYNLQDYLLALCTLYSLGVLLCVITVIAIFLVKHKHYGEEQTSQTDVLSLPGHMEATAYEENQSFSLRRPSNSPQQRQRRCTTSDLNLFPRITLPGMEERLSQSLGLPGDGQARLLRIRRHNSLDNIPQNNAGPQPEGGREVTRRTSNTSRTSGGGPRRQTQNTRQDNTINSAIDSENRRREARTQPQATRLYPHRPEREVHRSLSDSSGHRPHLLPYRHTDPHFLQTLPLYPPRPLLRTSYNGRDLSRQRRRQRARPNTHSYTGPRRLWQHEHYGLPSHMAYLHLMDSMSPPSWNGGGNNGGSFPYPSEPPPPYTHCELPPYMERDPAPSYRSRSSPVPSI